MSDEYVESLDGLDQPGDRQIDGPLDEVLDCSPAADLPTTHLTNEVRKQSALVAHLIDSQVQLHRLAEGFADSPLLRAVADITMAMHNIKVAEKITDLEEKLDEAGLGVEGQRATAKNLADSPAFQTLRQIGVGIGRWQQSHAAALNQTRAFLKKTGNSVGPRMTKVAAAIGRTIEDAHRRSVPPNWLIDNDVVSFSYDDAMRMALDEGIPLAWAPDPETVIALMTVQGDGTVRRSALRSVLVERSDAVLDYSEARLDELARDPSTSVDLLAMIDVAQQSIHALRFDLPAPAQAAAADLVDQLVRRVSTSASGKFAYRSARTQVEDLQRQTAAFSLKFFAVLRCSSRDCDVAGGSEGAHGMVAK